MKDFDTFTKIAKRCEQFGQNNFCTGFEKLPKAQKIVQSGHTGFQTSILSSQGERDTQSVPQDN